MKILDFVCVAFVINVYQSLWHRDTSLNSDNAPPNDPSFFHHSNDATRREPRLGDDCYHIYLDVGANVGVHGRFLYEPEKYRKSWGAVPLFNKRYGFNRANEDYCVFEVEANPRHWPRLDEVSEAYATMGWRYHVVHAAASDMNGEMTFFHQGDNHNNELGFSIKKRDLDWGKEELRQKETVPTIRLAEWIQHHILEREIPEVAPSGKNYSQPVIGMKLDIEGSEFVVLPDLLLSGVFCRLDFVFGEMHPNYAPLNFKGHRMPLKTEQDAKDLEDILLDMMESSRQCHTQFLSFDEEKYHRDGKELPTPDSGGSKETSIDGQAR